MNDTRTDIKKPEKFSKLVWNYSNTIEGANGLGYKNHTKALEPIEKGKENNKERWSKSFFDFLARIEKRFNERWGWFFTNPMKK